jgi:hypothetical protein
MRNVSASSTIVYTIAGLMSFKKVYETHADIVVLNLTRILSGYILRLPLFKEVLFRSAGIYAAESDLTLAEFL